MTGLRVLFRSVGGMWFVIGGLILVLAIGYIVAANSLAASIRSQFPDAGQVLTAWLRGIGVAPGIQEGLGLAFALFCILIGVGLFSLQSWTRTVGIAFHIVMAACLAALTLALYTQL